MIYPPIPAPTSRIFLISPICCRIFYVLYSASSLLYTIAREGRVDFFFTALGIVSASGSEVDLVCGFIFEFM